MNKINSVQGIEIKDGDRDTKWFRCNVVRVLKDKGFGFAVCRGDQMMFHGRQAMAVEAGCESPEFRPLTTEVVAPVVGGKIIAMVEKDQSGRYHATAWAPFEAYNTVKALMDEARLRAAPPVPKPAPALPKPIVSQPVSNHVVTAEAVVGPVQDVKAVAVPIMPYTHGAVRKARRIPGAGSVVPFEKSSVSQEAVSFLSGAVESAKAQAQA